MECRHTFTLFYIRNTTRKISHINFIINDMRNKPIMNITVLIRTLISFIQNKCYNFYLIS